MQIGASTEPAPEKRSLFGNLYLQVMVAIIAGGLIGYFYSDLGVALQPLGTGFIKLVKMIIAPVIFLTVVTGIAGMRDLKGLGSVVAKALGYFFVVSTLALIVGLIVANVVQPGAGMNIDPSTLDASAVNGFAAAAHDQTVVDFIMNIIPSTVVGAFAGGEILQVLLFSVLFGIALAMTGDAGEPLVDLLNVAAGAFFQVVHIIMKAAPIGAFGAFAFTIGRYGLDAITSLAALVGTFYLTSALFVVIVLGLIAWANGFSIFRLIAYLRNELMLVLGTSSSESVLPSLIEKMEVAGCRKSVVGLVVPTGYSFNLDGTNIYMTLAALFIAQATGVNLSFGDQLLLLAVAMLSSKGAAGVTGAGFITLAATLAVVPSVPVAGMALILGVDRFMSECRAITNFIGNAVATIVVARWENAIDANAFAATLGGRTPRAAAPGHAAAAWAIASVAIIAGIGATVFLTGPDALARNAEGVFSASANWLHTVIN
ncbi:MAG: dicarboxylate/amino acid:cation symporter [Hyphomonadaceae bacterium]